MHSFNTGPAGGLAPSRNLGTKVIVAGKTMFLPNIEVPNVVQELTMEQIVAIPQDRFVVSLMDPSMPIVSAFGGRKGRRTSLSVRVRQRHLRGIKDNVIGFVSPDSSKMTQVSIDSTKEFTTLITLINQASQQTGMLFGRYRKLSRTLTRTPHAESGIFYKPINDDALSDCILEIIGHYFKTGDTTKILGREYKLVTFCVLMHFYFIRIGIIENRSRKPFSNFLTKNVFGEEEKFSVKTFNNNANELADVEQDFTEHGRLKIDFNVRPNPSGKPVQDAFHEIGYAFHHSHYFEELRKLRKRMEDFKF